MSRLFAFALAYALLTGCATQTPETDQLVDTEGESATPAAVVPERPFPNDSFYDLLVAEFALRRHDYELTLNKYMQQAPKLRDAGVSAHTTHLTQFLQRDDDTLESAQLWVALDPQNAEANNTLATLLAHKGRTVEALPHLVIVEQQTGSANFPMLVNGFSQLSDEQRDLLVEGIDSLAAKYPKNTRLLLTQALIDAEFQQFDKALDDLDTLLELEPDQQQAILLEARILVEQNAEYPYARLQKALNEKPDATMLRLQYARLLTASDMPAALEQFEILSEQAPRDGDLLFSIALINREIGDVAATRSYLEQVIALGQRADEANFYLGRMAEEDNNPDEAISYYMKVEDGAEYLAASSRIGQIMVDKGQLQQSHAWFNEQRAANPKLQEQLFGLEADILTQADATQEAMQVLSQALSETPDSTTALRYARAMLSEQMDDLVSMERDLRTILASDPDNTTALNALGYTLADRTTRYQEAQALVARALALQPNEPAIMDSMGWVLFRTGNYEESVEYLSRAYAEFPDPEVAAHLGEVLWVKGDTVSAIKVWQGALVRDPGHPILLETLRRLDVTIPDTAPPASSPAEQQS